MFIFLQKDYLECRSKGLQVLCWLHELDGYQDVLVPNGGVRVVVLNKLKNNPSKDHREPYHDALYNKHIVIN